MRSDKWKGALFFTIIVISSLACSLSGRGEPSITVELQSPEDGAFVTQGEIVSVVTSAISDNGVSKIYFSVDGEIVQTDEPGGLPQFHVSDFSWMSDKEGDVVLSVAAVDGEGQSAEPVSINLHVLGADASSVTEIPEPASTNTPEATSTNSPQPAAATDTPKPMEPTWTPTMGSVSGVMLWPSIEEVRNSGTIAPNSTDHVFAQCPAGGVVVGGGYSNAKPDDVDIVITRRKDDGWIVYGVNNSPNPHDVVSQVICLMNDTSASSTMVQSQGSLPADQFGWAHAECPAGTTATGGGYGADTWVEVTESLPGSNGWQVNIKNTVGNNKSFYAYAVCLSSNFNISTRVVSDTPGIPAKDSSGGGGSCGPGEYATGGGFRIDGVYNLDIIRSMHADDGGWQVNAQNPTEYGHQLEIYYFCLIIE